MSKNPTMQRYQKNDLEALGAAIFRAAGSDANEARIVADHLVEANLVGHDSHGFVRVSKYLDWVDKGQVVPNRHVRIVSDKGAALLVDGDFGYGQVIGIEAMDLLAQRVRSNGFAACAIRNAAHLGRIGAWPEQLAKAGFPSFHFVNTSGFGILVAPHGGSDRRLSANPVAAGTPTADGRIVVLDIATSVVAEGKIQMMRNKGEKLAPGWVVDGFGKPTDDPNAFYASPPGAIFPFGGHKGSGLSFFCEVLAGSLTGGFASNPRSPTAGRLVNNMLSIAFDPAAFGGADFFKADLDRLIDWTTASPPIEPGGAVLLPGEIELLIRTDREDNGIPIDPETWSQVAAAASKVGVDTSAYIGS